jgi:hypothetical protein
VIESDAESQRVSYKIIIFKNTVANTVELLLYYSKMIDSRFRVHARPGATGCGYEFVFPLYGLGLPIPHLDMPGLARGSKVIKF